MKYFISMIRGIFTPNVVPFYDDHRINEGELRRYTNWLIEKGVTGLYYFNAIRSKLACLLSECGFEEAAASCQEPSGNVNAMLERLRRRLP